MKQRSKLMVAGAAVLLAGGALGSIAGVAISASNAPAEAASDSPPSATTPAESGIPTVERFETNARGQTLGEYGVGLDDDPSATPDLLRAVGTNGREGYILTVDAFGAPAGSLPEAERSGEPREREIPVYEADGVTQIGVYLADYGH